MPRQAHGRPIHLASSKQRHKRQKRNNGLNALELAEKQTVDRVKIPQHRLGEVEDDADDYLSRTNPDGRSSKKRKINDAPKEGEDRVVLLDSDAGASGSDDEGGRWHEGVDASDEDSDIDSDEAFGESDEERFAHFTFRGSRPSPTPAKQKKKLTKTVSMDNKINLDEDSGGWQDAEVLNKNENEGSDYSGLSGTDDEGDDLGDGAVDLATALEMNLKEEKEETERAMRTRGKRKQPKTTYTVTDEDDAIDSEDLSSDAESELSISESESMGDHADLRSFVASLESSNPARSTKPRTSSKALPAVASSFAVGSSKISASDLLQYVRDPVQRESLKLVQASERTVSDDYTQGIPGKLSAPLAKRQQDKLDRAAAYEKSKDTLNRWVDTVKSNRRAEHISFPLNDPGSLGTRGSKNLQNTSFLAPQSDLEVALQSIIHESGLGANQSDGFEEREATFEELQERKLPVEEVRERRAQLKLARELMFREEIRAKRIKKIKSKAYRRVHRKERDKIEAQQRDQLAAAGLLNSDEERERNDKRRAEERMGARHKESKWAKGVKQIGRAAWDEDARLGVSDLARRDEELRRRIDGKNVHDDGLTDSESSSGADDTDTEEHRLFAKLDELEGAATPTSGLASMVFMQRAEAVRKAHNDEELRQLRLAVGGTENVISDEEQTNTEISGRQSFGVRKEQRKQNSRPVRTEFEAPLSDEDIEEANHAHTRLASVEHDQALQGQPAGKISLRAATTRHHGERNATKRLQTYPSSASTAPQTQQAAEDSTQLDDYTSPSESEDEISTPTNAYDTRAALAASIFAGPDDAVEEFKKEKKQAVEEEEDQVINGALPGWGSWTGAGVSKHERKKAKGKHSITIKGVAAADRQDAKLDRVIMNEKRVKKNGKYLATELPHPFETKQQYERSLRLPMGPEWSTVKHYQDAIKPRILLKQGVVIKPMSRPSG